MIVRLIIPLEANTEINFFDVYPFSFETIISSSRSRFPDIN